MVVTRRGFIRTALGAGGLGLAESMPAAKGAKPDQFMDSRFLGQLL